MHRNHYGKPGNTIAGAERRKIITWIEQGLPRNEIAKLAGRSGSTVSGIAKTEGLEFGRRAEVAAATAARTVDLAARRAAIVEREYTRIEHLQHRRSAPKFKTIMKAEMGAERVAELDFLPTVDERNIADTISRMVAATSRLVEMDAERGVADAKSLLTRLGRELGIGGE